VIVGGGAAGLAAADMLRREAYDGPITIISADDSPPPDRPNLSKDYLTGTAQEDWIPLRAPEFYTDNHIELMLGARVSSLDVARREVVLESGSRHSFGALLIATGANPIHLPIPGADAPEVHYLRSFADSKAIIQKTQQAKKVVVAGASFIGLEVAASLRNRDIAVDVVAPERVPLERVMGVELGRFIQTLHESHGVVFHLGETVTSIDGRRVSTSGGSTLDADFVVMGVGVRPSTALAEQAGLAVDRGIVVNEYLETSAPGIFAAGDIARWPDPHTGSASASNTGSSPSARGRRRPETFSDGAKYLTVCRFSGVSTTTSRLTMWAMPSGGTRFASTAASMPTTARSATCRETAVWRSRRFFATAKASRRSSKWNVPS
jgi:NADPH-dependent 2,4-dienoyl-CoA reductase/sulfur reductase-like enzyme